MVILRESLGLILLNLIMTPLPKIKKIIPKVETLLRLEAI